ncbi:MAG: HAD family hydrolase [Cytophagaceae bacterium]
MSVNTDQIQAYIFDMDGVITDTATLHKEAWEAMFNLFLQDYPDSEKFNEKDYYLYLNGIPRHEGIKNFLRSRNITIPEGEKDDSAETRSIHGLGRLKNDLFKSILQHKPVKVFDDALEFLETLKEKGTPTALISASKNAERLIKNAGITGLFDVIADGNLLEEKHLNGKPEPDIFHYAAKELSIAPENVAIVEDARAGIKAGKKGGFGLIIALERENAQESLSNTGADVVIENLRELQIEL